MHFLWARCLEQKSSAKGYPGVFLVTARPDSAIQGTGKEVMLAKINNDSSTSLPCAVLNNQGQHGCSRCHERQEEILAVWSQGLIQEWGLSSFPPPTSSVDQKNAQIC